MSIFYAMVIGGCIGVAWCLIERFVFKIGRVQMNSLLTKDIIRREAVMIMHQLTGRDWREFDHDALSVEMDPVSWWNDAWESQPPDMKLTFWLDGRHVSCEITKSTLLMSIEEFAHRIITPMCKQLTPWSDEMGLWAQFCEDA